MGVVVLRLLIQIAGGADAVDHAAAHGDRGGHDVLEEVGAAGVAHGGGAALGDGEVDGSGEVEGDGARVSEVCLVS